LVVPAFAVDDGHPTVTSCQLHISTVGAGRPFMRLSHFSSQTDPQARKEPFVFRSGGRARVSPPPRTELPPPRRRRTAMR
jgi:hypothetical protein